MSDPRDSLEVAADGFSAEILSELASGRGAEEEEPSLPLPRALGAAAQASDVASMLFADFIRQPANEEQSTAVSVKLPSRRDPDSVADLFRQHAVVRSVGLSADASDAMITLPSVGDQLFGFRLRQELGRGAFASVFLAEQADLAGRPVVLKVSSIDGNEPQVLAQLQHTHIVPIYSVHEDARSGLRAVCMPYFGGASLAHVLRACWANAEQPRAGHELIQALRAVESPWDPNRSGEPHAEAPAVTLLTRLSYVEAAAWMTCRLAEALHHAHRRGILHRDIKPSNILVGTEGEPMLLDFNLAQSNANGKVQAHATLGGTIAYMAPEHLRALAARTEIMSRQVDERADIYSLGMVLYEMLTGRSPFDSTASFMLPQHLEAMAVERARDIPSPRRSRADVPWGLESIVRKCLQPDVSRRYQKAEHLAEDLHAFLHDLPLRHAPELSRGEQVQKWVRRHPRLTSSGMVGLLAGLLLLGSGAALAGVRSHLIQTSDQLAVKEAHERKAAFQEGTLRALCLVNTTGDLKDHLPRGRAICEETLAHYGVLDREDWQEQPAWQKLAPEDRHALAEDARELLLLLAWSRTRLAPGDKDTLRGALRLLDQAEAVAGLEPSRALWEERAFYLERLGNRAEAATARARAEQTSPATARDHYLLASAWVRNAHAGEERQAYARAVEALTKAIALNPRHYWSRMQRGICYQELGDYELAAADFGACIGSWPEFAWGHFNQGFVLGQSGKRQQSIEAYTAALQRDPEFVPAYVNRGLALLELKQYQAALADLDRALALGRYDAALLTGRGVALEGVGRGAEADAAFAQAFVLSPDCNTEAGQRLRWVYGFAVYHRIPERADAAFGEILRVNPDHPQALYGKALLRIEGRGRIDEAINLFNRALDANPGFVEARRFRAVLLARRGNFEAASQDINLCLEKDRRAGPNLYAAACVTALMAGKASKQAEVAQASEQALAFLRLALDAGYGHDKAESDPDLDAVRGQAEFRRLLATRPPPGAPNQSAAETSIKGG